MSGIVKRRLKYAARSLLLAYAVLYLMTMWTAESVYERRITFQRNCEAVGGFVTSVQSCARVRLNHGMFQL